MSHVGPNANTAQAVELTSGMPSELMEDWTLTLWMSAVVRWHDSPWALYELHINTIYTQT